MLSVAPSHLQQTNLECFRQGCPLNDLYNASGPGRCKHADSVMIMAEPYQPGAVDSCKAHIVGAAVERSALRRMHYVARRRN